MLHVRLFGHADRSQSAQHQDWHGRRLVAMNDEATAAGVRHLVVTYPHGSHYALFVDWERWQVHFPATLEASMEAYQRYLTKLHPWALEVEPRLLDPQWLTRLIDRTPPRG